MKKKKMKEEGVRDCFIAQRDQIHGGEGGRGKGGNVKNSRGPRPTGREKKGFACKKRNFEGGGRKLSARGKVSGGGM